MTPYRFFSCGAWPLLVLVSVLLAAALVLAQSSNQERKAPPPQEEKKEKKEKRSRRIFKGKITLRSSHQESETAAAGFKGVDEDGRVEQAVLASQPSAEHHAKVAQLASYQVAADELSTFIQQGRLKSQPPGRSRRRRG